ncbi:UvrD like super family I helicase [Cryptosporidium canis]|uniref:DNA 3'-5' helicase n=1 Tax=Cryptosporidium canis TaxID=195482 RepID=A0A9D5DLR8_9CRYT|nr:UvrD like super family I helicase [Cryptosporidium canis]
METTEKNNESNDDSSIYFEKDDRLHSMSFGRLTNEQRKAVFISNESSLLIVAGPGTGKTATLTSRIVRFLINGYSPILALTFTRKAANELKNRVSTIYSSSSKNINSMSKSLKNLHRDSKMFASTPEIFIGTIHSFCWKILKEYGVFMGLPKDISIIDKDMAIKLLRSCITEELSTISSQLSGYSFIFDPSNLDEIDRDDFDDSEDESMDDEAKVDKNEQLNRIGGYLDQSRKVSDGCKAISVSELEKILKIIKLMKIKKYINNTDCTIEDFHGNRELFRVYRLYTKKMTIHKPYLLDYTDLITLTLNLLETNIIIREKIQHSYPYIFCDEFQDTSKLQLKMLELLAKRQNSEKNNLELDEHTNNKCVKMGGITVVGDDDQAIYSWRGVDSGVFLQFSSTFKQNLKMTYLTKNFRSSRSIITVANHLIKKNKYRIDKSLSCDNHVGVEPKVFYFSKQIDELQWVASTILLLKIKFNYSWSDFAILARTNDTLFYVEKIFNDNQFLAGCLDALQDKENNASERNWSKMISSDLLNFDINQLNQYKSTLTSFPTENTSRSYIKTAWDILNKTEILDILSYCRLIIDETADDCFLRICNRPKRGIGMNAIRLIEELGANGISLMRKSTQPLNGICELNYNSNKEIENSYISILSVCRLLQSNHPELKSKLDSKLHKKTINSIGSFLEFLDDLKQFVKKKVSVPEIINMIVKKMKFDDQVETGKHSKKIKISPNSTSNFNDDKEHSAQLRKLEAFNAISVLIKYSEPYTPNEEQPTGYECLLCFLQDASNGLLRMRKQEKISLSTVHKSKGLEWKVVFIPKFVDKVFPLYRESESPVLNNEINEMVSEEERRIAYVAFTRAKERLFISVPLNVGKPSPFIHDANLSNNKAPKERELIKQFPRTVQGINWKKN